jgi:hypothetical protein
MPGAVSRFREELRQILVIAVYFAAGFCLIIVAERLFTRRTGIEIAGFARAVVVGSLLQRIPHKPLIHNIPVAIPRRSVAALLRQNLGS